nr:MAG TPA: hypothetical protein [Caudoviricetes sp.]
MTREEFETNLKEIQAQGCMLCMPMPTEQEYKAIEYVYTFHPSISETEGKKQVAYLYENFGMSIFKDMEARADYMRVKEWELQKAIAEVERIRKQMEKVKAGGEMPNERED